MNEMYMVRKVVALENEFVSKDILDANGSLCVMVIILTDFDGLSFNSFNSMCKDNVVESGRY